MYDCTVCVCSIESMLHVVTLTGPVRDRARRVETAGMSMCVSPEQTVCLLDLAVDAAF